MEKVRKGILYSVIASEGIHIFCCVLPTVFSILSLLAGMGMIATMPGFIDDMHHMIHDYEIPMIIFSAVILVVGWILYAISRKIDCSDEGKCSHEPCAPKKDRARLVMIIATILFTVNVSVYFAFHRAGEVDIHVHDVHIEDPSNGYHDHDHHNH